MAWIMSMKARAPISFVITQGIGFGRAVSAPLHDQLSQKVIHEIENTLLYHSIMVCSC